MPAPMNQLVRLCGATVSKIVRKVATIMIQTTAEGMRTRQPNLMNWSYRSRGRVPRSQM